jgi:hypothetical protein
VTDSAWIMLVLTWSAVGGTVAFLVYRVLTTPPRDGD